MKTCNYINSTLVFSAEEIVPCDLCYKKKLPTYFKKGDEDFPNFERKKTLLIQDLNSENISNYKCKNCVHFHKTDNIQEKYNKIIINLFDNKKTSYCLEEIFENLQSRNLLDNNNLIIEVQASKEETIDYLSEIITIFKIHGYKKLNFKLKEILYHEIIDSTLFKENGSLTIIATEKVIKKLANIKDYEKPLRTYVRKILNKKSIKITYEISSKLNKKEITNFVKTIYKNGFEDLTIKINENEFNDWTDTIPPLKKCNKKYVQNTLFLFRLLRKYQFHIHIEDKEQIRIIRNMFKTNKQKRNYFFKKIKKLFYKDDV